MPAPSLAAGHCDRPASPSPLPPRAVGFRNSRSFWPVAHCTATVGPRGAGAVNERVRDDADRRPRGDHPDQAVRFALADSHGGVAADGELRQHLRLNATRYAGYYRSLGSGGHRLTAAHSSCRTNGGCRNGPRPTSKVGLCLPLGRQPLPIPLPGKLPGTKNRARQPQFGPDLRVDPGAHFTNKSLRIGSAGRQRPGMPLDVWPARIGSGSCVRAEWIICSRSRW